MKMKKYVWLNLNTGEFSNAWDEAEHDKNKEASWYKNGLDGWKLIEFTCLNDPKFEFYDKMKIVTNTNA